MKIPANEETAQMFLLQAASEGREALLFGDSFQRVQKILPDFLATDSFPTVYLEFPLLGDPFLDVTIMYSQERSSHIQVRSPAAEGTQKMMEWFLRIPGKYRGVWCGYELDTKAEELTAAGVHFQPRKHLELVEPFCASLGEDWCAQLYLDLARRLHGSWSPAFFGLFRGRPHSPLRISGYLGKEELNACAEDPERILKVFQTAGFTAFDEPMVRQISTLMAAAPNKADFQFDLYPDGSCGEVFSIDANFALRPLAAVQESFREGKNRELMRLLENWGLTDERWKKAVEMYDVRAFPVRTVEGGERKYVFSLVPHWIKIRWADKKLQPAKLYFLAKTWLIEGKR